ncbi:hypothetical protein ACQEVY_16255 [Streptomyces sp. CA-288835]|uniref:hypothetical protein n=1 Tax=Streptomyces sp. CA-288835 TaxID=3240069 RepID=UPI003D91055C
MSRSGVVSRRSPQPGEPFQHTREQVRVVDTPGHLDRVLPLADRDSQIMAVVQAVIEQVDENTGLEHGVMECTRDLDAFEETATRVGVLTSGQVETAPGVGRVEHAR